jgi:hypothetical protein
LDAGRRWDTFDDRPDNLIPYPTQRAEYGTPRRRAVG